MYPSVDAGGNAVEVGATLSVPKKPGVAGDKAAAVILLHSKGGWNYPVTAQYARALADAGFVVLEPQLFANPASVPPTLPIPMVYDGLRYLAARNDIDPKRIGVAGFSYGGMLALHAAAAWSQSAYARNPDLKFAAHAPFYPVCWTFTAFVQGKRKVAGIPDNAFEKWTGAPVRIFAGGRDDYDDRDPKACDEFVARLPAADQSLFSVKVYPEATHGWDQQGAAFYEKMACKGRGCRNSNVADSELTQQSIGDLVEFFTQTLR